MDEDERQTQDKKMKQPVTAKRQILNLLIIVLLIMLTVWILAKKFKATDISDLAEKIEGIDMDYLSMAVLFLVLYVMCEGLCLKVLSHYFNARMSFGQATIYAAIEMYFSGITPSAAGGQPVAVYYMNRDGIRVTDGTLMFILNLFMYALVLLVMEVPAVITNFAYLAETPVLFEILFIVGNFWQIAMVVGCLICMFSQKAINWFEGFMIRCCDKWKIIKDKEGKKKQAVEGIERYKDCMRMVRTKPLMSLELFGTNLLERVAFFSIGYYVYRAFGYDSASFWSVMTLQVIVTLAMYSLPIPGGIGAAEMSFMVVFGTIYSQSALMPGMLLTRGINYYSLIVLTGLAALGYHLYLTGRDHAESRIRR